MKYGEIKRYLIRRLFCSQKDFKNKVNEPMVPQTGLYNLDDEVIAYSKKNFDKWSYDWFPYSGLQAKLNAAISIPFGNAALIENPAFYKSTILAKSKINLFKTEVNQIAKLSEVLDSKLDFKQNSYENGVLLLASKNVAQSIKILTEFENSEAEKTEEFYLTLGLAYRYKNADLSKASDLSKAIEVYDRGLNKFPNSSKIMMAKASTLVYTDDSTNKNSMNLFLQAIEQELKTKGELSAETLKSIEDFRSQLKFLNRTGDLDSFKQKLDVVKKQYSKPS